MYCCYYEIKKTDSIASEILL